MADYKAVVVKAGSGGFGGPLTLVPDAKKNKVVNITGGVMSKVAERLAEMTGCELVDGFKTRVPDDEILVVVIDCGGSLSFFYCGQLSICDNRIFDDHTCTPRTLSRIEHRREFRHKGHFSCTLQDTS
ncbi:MAG: hypothetical protein IKO05_09820 [Selenomonadaceae bacterium]|nr:hypothetical protein [Selenomonadaceae bacterium]